MYDNAKQAFNQAAAAGWGEQRGVSQLAEVREREIHRWINSIQQRLCAIENSTEMLVDRLRLVSCPRPQTANKETTRPGASTEIGGSLCNIDERLQAVLERITAQTDSLEI